MHAFPPVFSEVTDFRASSMAANVIATTRSKIMALRPLVVPWHVEETRHNSVGGEHCSFYRRDTLTLSCTLSSSIIFSERLSDRQLLSTKSCSAGRINVYNYTATSLPPTPTPTTVSVTVPSATITDLPTGWTYKGCWVDRALGRGSILADNLPNDANMTVESCIQNCITAGYSIAGMEYYTQCYCDSAVINLGALASSDSQCNTPCGGNANQ